LMLQQPAALVHTIRRATGAHQVALKCHRSSLVSELDDDIYGPRAVLGCVTVTAGVVGGMPLRDVGGDASVVTSRNFAGLQYLDESLRHGSGWSKRPAARE
jgi:hypothetical protein